jgi:hypothetical protein
MSKTDVVKPEAQNDEEAPLVNPATTERLRLRSNLRAGDFTPAPAPTGPRIPDPPPPRPKAI